MNNNSQPGPFPPRPSPLSAGTQYREDEELARALQHEEWTGGPATSEPPDAKTSGNLGAPGSSPSPSPSPSPQPPNFALPVNFSNSDKNAIFDVLTNFFGARSKEEAQTVADELLELKNTVYARSGFLTEKNEPDRFKRARDELNKPSDEKKNDPSTNSNDPSRNSNDRSVANNQDLGELVIGAMDASKQLLIRLSEKVESVLYDFSHDCSRAFDSVTQANVLTVAQAILLAGVVPEHKDPEKWALALACWCLEDVATPFERREKTLDDGNKTAWNKNRTLDGDYLLEIVCAANLPEELVDLRNRIRRRQPKDAVPFDFPLSFMTDADWTQIHEIVSDAIENAGEDVDLDDLSKELIKIFAESKLASLTAASFPFIPAFDEGRTAENEKKATTLSLFTNIIHCLDLTYLADDVRAEALQKILRRVSDEVDYIFSSKEKPQSNNNANL